MGIKEQIQKDLTAAMKGKETVRIEALRLIRAELLKKEKEKNAKEINDEVVLQILRSMTRQQRDAIEQFQNGNRPDLVAKEQAQLEIIESYLPAQINEETVDRIIDEVITETGATSLKDMGKVMGQVMKRLQQTGGLVEGSSVNAKVKARLG